MSLATTQFKYRLYFNLHPLPTWLLHLPLMATAPYPNPVIFRAFPACSGLVGRDLGEDLD